MFRPNIICYDGENIGPVIIYPPAGRDSKESSKIMEFEMAFYKSIIDILDYGVVMITKEKDMYRIKAISSDDVAKIKKEIDNG